MVILVTGSSGFIGNSLIPKLKKIGYDVIGLDRKPGENTDLIQDISKKFKINKPIETIIHLAARLEHERCSKKEFFSTNVDGTKNLLNIAEENNSYFIHTSTTAVFGSPPCPIKETTSICTNGYYAESKWQSEKLFKDTNIKYTIIRSTAILGEERLGIYEIIFKKLFENLTIPILGDGKNKISFVNVDDINDFIIHLIKNPSYSKTINFGGVIPGELNEMIEELKEYTKSSSRILHIPKSFLGTLSFLSRIKLLPLTPWQLSVMCKDNFYDDTVLLSTGYNYKYQPISALKKMADTFQKTHDF